MGSTARGRRRAFSTTELVVAVAILAILVVAAVPMTGKVLTYQARSATRTELQALSDASGEFFRDTRRLPSAVGELLADTGVPGWAGPYLPGVLTDVVTGKSVYEVDAWSRSYVLAPDGDVLSIASSGEDAHFGDANDLSIALNVTWIRRQETLDELKLINQAIVLYNGRFQMSAPLDTQWSTAVGQLVAQGFLPSAEDYENDGWDAPYEADPPGKAPLVKVQSTSIRGKKDEKQ